VSPASRPKVAAIFGTRPEAIKMAPVIEALRRHAAEIETRVVVTAQHRSMLDQVLGVFRIVPDRDLDIMEPGHSLARITVRVIEGVEALIREESPDLVLVQGDTTSAFAAGLAAFYRRVAVGHVEAGLRTGDKYSPYPEEINRRLLDAFSDLCFAPTETARAALLAEGIADSRILVSGNTVIDALLDVAARRHRFAEAALRQLEPGGSQRILLVTTHRRESFGTGLESICHALGDLLRRWPDLRVVFPVHLNPSVRQAVFSILDGVERVLLTDPLDYLDFVHLMKSCHLILTDSGGVQEEAPSLGKPVLVAREVTERPEAVAAGAARLVGTGRQGIVEAASLLLGDAAEYARMSRAINPYGDGRAAPRIVDAIRHSFGLLARPPEPFGGR
jgi:UDP-N-acetylglucosamine 2-epimerase (non-hydrolysing)